jgi:hypothetical protein
MDIKWNRFGCLDTHGMLKALEIGCYTLLNILLTELNLVQSVKSKFFKIHAYKLLRITLTIINTPPLLSQLKMEFYCWKVHDLSRQFRVKF